MKLIREISLSFYNKQGRSPLQTVPFTLPSIRNNSIELNYCKSKRVRRRTWKLKVKGKIMFKNIQAYFKTFGFIIPFIFLFIFYWIKNNNTLILLLFYFFNLIYFIWLVSILYLTYLILKKNKITTINYISLVNNWEFIVFKNKLFQFYSG